MKVHEEQCGSYPNPDPHENQVRWCRACDGLGHKPHVNGKFATTCNDCGGLGILDENRVVRTIPDVDPQIAKTVEMGVSAINECLMHIEVLDHRLKALGELLTKLRGLT